MAVVDWRQPHLLLGCPPSGRWRPSFCSGHRGSDPWPSLAAPAALRSRRSQHPPPLRAEGLLGVETAIPMQCRYRAPPPSLPRHGSSRAPVALRTARPRAGLVAPGGPRCRHARKGTQLARHRCPPAATPAPPAVPRASIAGRRPVPAPEGLGRSAPPGPSRRPGRPPLQRQLPREPRGPGAAAPAGAGPERGGAGRQGREWRPGRGGEGGCGCGCGRDRGPGWCGAGRHPACCACCADVSPGDAPGTCPGPAGPQQYLCLLLSSGCKYKTSSGPPGGRVPAAASLDGPAAPAAPR